MRENFVSMNDLRNMEQEGIRILISRYTTIESLSKEYSNMNVIMIRNNLEI